MKGENLKNFETQHMTSVSKCEEKRLKSSKPVPVSGCLPGLLFDR